MQYLALKNLFLQILNTDYDFMHWKLKARQAAVCLRHDLNEKFGLISAEIKRSDRQKSRKTFLERLGFDRTVHKSLHSSLKLDRQVGGSRFCPLKFIPPKYNMSKNEGKRTKNHLDQSDRGFRKVQLCKFEI